MTLSALLLAGGESRRMGKDKATLEFGGQPFWERQVETLRALEPNQILVSARTAPGWLPADVELLLDDPPSCGPLSGIAKALTTIRTTHLLVLAVDMPFMTVGEVKRLSKRLTDGCGVVPTCGDRAEPLAAIYPREALNEFTAALRGSDFSLQKLIQQLAAIGKVCLWPIQEEFIHLYQSVNEPADLTEGRFLNRPRE